MDMSNSDLVTFLVNHAVQRYQEVFGRVIIYGQFQWSEKQINEIKNRAIAFVSNRNAQGVSPTSPQGRAIVRDFMSHWDFLSCLPVWLDEPPYLSQFEQDCRQVWKGKLRELAAIGEKEVPNIDAPNKTKAWEVFAGRYKKANGNPISGKSLQQNLRNKRGIEGKID
jgi:hypothetical protein